MTLIVLRDHIGNGQKGVTASRRYSRRAGGKRPPLHYYTDKEKKIICFLYEREVAKDATKTAIWKFIAEHLQKHMDGNMSAGSVEGSYRRMESEGAFPNKTIDGKWMTEAELLEAGLEEMVEEEV